MLRVAKSVVESSCIPGGQQRAEKQERHALDLLRPLMVAEELASNAQHLLSIPDDFCLVRLFGLLGVLFHECSAPMIFVVPPDFFRYLCISASLTLILNSLNRLRPRIFRCSSDTCQLILLPLPTLGGRLGPRRRVNIPRTRRSIERGRSLS